jgi:hypothetical protein
MTNLNEIKNDLDTLQILIDKENRRKHFVALAQAHAADATALKENTEREISNEK